ncbi:uncharacterized protein LOC132119041 [Carassius carassius]|uniref:uncharacterized protein LOC132119041 n=1 Tax=Carassius carassius TaxID=217509 RepID=UPI00286896FD|nr:uncharacterized protein LOC132119041 [Carassius carassius]
MNRHITAHKAKVRNLCIFLILCFYLVYAGVPGPCKHSVTRDHLLNLRRLMKNQLQNGCSITFTFTERQNLSVVCYVKAAFPHILELLNTQFRYAKDSDNYRYTNSLKNLIYNVYSQRCIPPINEENENSPMRFLKAHMTLPREALEKAEEVIRMYMGLMTQSDKPVDWNCEEEYTEDLPESSTEPLSQTAGASDCPCICPAVSTGSSQTSASTSHWNIHLKPTPSPQRSSFSPVVTLQGGNEGTKQFRSAVPLALGMPATWRSTQGDLSNFLFDSTPSFHEETSNSEMDHLASPDLFPSLTNFQDVFSSRIDSRAESASSGHSHKSDSMQDSVERSTLLLLAKRSLDSKSEEQPSSVKSSQNWDTATSKKYKKYKSMFFSLAYKNLKNTEIKGKPFQMLQPHKYIAPVTTTALSFKADAHSSEGLSTLVEQPVHLKSPPENFQTHTQSPVRVPRNFMRTIHEMKLRKNRRSQEDRQEMKDQTHPDRETHRNSATEQSTRTIISFGTMLIIILGCGGLLLITVQFYRRQKSK